MRINFNSWIGKRLLKHIENNQEFKRTLKGRIAIIDSWIERDIAKLNKRLKEMNDQDYLLFINETGYNEVKR